ncbi:hypothetical protein [Luteococcus sediminum]
MLVSQNLPNTDAEAASIRDEVVADVIARHRSLSAAFSLADLGFTYAALSMSMSRWSSDGPRDSRTSSWMPRASSSVIERSRHFRRARSVRRSAGILWRTTTMCSMQVSAMASMMACRRRVPSSRQWTLRWDMRSDDIIVRTASSSMVDTTAAARM